MRLLIKESISIDKKRSRLILMLVTTAVNVQRL